VAGHLAECSGTIAKAKPDLRPKITRRLLSIDNTRQKHKDLVKAYVLDAFDKYFNEAENKNEIMQFARQQLNCTSPKTRKKANNWPQSNQRDREILKISQTQIPPR
jgi:DNA repair ATPase RecN